MIRLFRHDGTPIDKDAVEARKKAMNDKVNELEALHGPINKDNTHLFQGPLEEVDMEFSVRFPVDKSIEYPKSEKELKKLIALYKAPIVFCVEEDEIVAYIMSE